MTTKTRSITMSLVLGGLVASSALGAESLRMTAPPVLPRNQGLGEFSPFLAFSYSGLKKGESYALKVWLLQAGGAYNCASSQLCEKVIGLSGVHGDATDGCVRFASPIDVFDYPAFLFVARLFNEAGVEAASAQLKAESVVAEPPVLSPIGRRVGSVGQQVRLVFSARCPAGDKVSFRILDAPADSKLDAETGVFTWTPAVPGLHRIVVEAVSKGTKLADAEIIALDIAQPGEAAVPGDGGPGVKP